MHIAGSYHGTRPHLDEIVKCPDCKEKKQDMVISGHMLNIIERAEKLLRDNNVPFTPYLELVKQMQCPACNEYTIKWHGDEFGEGSYCSNKECGYEEE